MTMSAGERSRQTFGEAASVAGAAGVDFAGCSGAAGLGKVSSSPKNEGAAAVADLWLNVSDILGITGALEYLGRSISATKQGRLLLELGSAMIGGCDENSMTSRVPPRRRRGRAS
jgi:hypothetical protein